MSTPGTSSLYIATAYDIIINFLLMICIAHIGSITSREPKKLVEMLAKLINELSLNHPSRFVLYNYMKQFQTRNFIFKTLFLTINWNILLGVRLNVLLDWNTLKCRPYGGHVDILCLEPSGRFKYTVSWSPYGQHFNVC